MKKKHINKLKKGFSLMETLIWVSIVGIFLGLIAVVGVTQIDRAKVKAAKQELNLFYAALIEYNENEGGFPTEEEGLNILVEKDYIKLNKSKITDPWGSDYIYETILDGKGFIIKSLGSDKKEGGDNTAKDIIITTHSSEIKNIESSFDYGGNYTLEK